MPPCDDVHGLAEPYLARAAGDGSLGEQRIGAELGSFRLEVMFRHEEVVEAEPIGENALAHLIHYRALTALVHLGRVPSIEHDAVGRPRDREFTRTVVKNTYFLKKKVNVVAGFGAAAEVKIDSADLSAWLSDRWMRDWLASEPALADEDLRAYFYFARDRLGPMGGIAQRISPRAQEMLAQLFHESAAARTTILKKSKELSAADVAAVFEALAERARREEDHGEPDSALTRIFDWVEVHPDLFSQVIALLGSLPDAGLPPSVVLKVLALSEGAEKGAVARKVLGKWASSSSNDVLRKAAEARLKSGK